MTDIAPIQEIIDEMRQGRMVVLIDEEDRENEGDLVLQIRQQTPDRPRSRDLLRRSAPPCAPGAFHQ